MDQQLETSRAEALAAIAAAGDEAGLEAARVKYLGRSGTISLASEGMKSLPKEDKPRIGKLLNEVRTAVTSALDERKAALEAERDSKALGSVDVSLPGTILPAGSIHPITQLLDRAIQIFRQMGFDLPDGRLLRTQTSTVQIRTMEQTPPPVRIIAPGGVYRRDEVDATHLAQFTQIEGLYVDKGVTLGDLKGTIEFFFRELLGNDVQVRMRPHFFPFTEPSFEIDIKAAALGRGDRWLELAGCGMVDPAVFEEINKKRGDRAYEPGEYTGFAFGFGLDRLAMILCGVPDIRHFTESDVRFLAQY